MDKQDECDADRERNYSSPDDSDKALPKESTARASGGVWAGCHRKESAEDYPRKMSIFRLLLCLIAFF